MAALSPITSTGRSHREVRIDSREDFGGILQAVYQVRCNLFHGGKRETDPRDQTLVKVGARMLEKRVGNLVDGWR